MKQIFYHVVTERPMKLHQIIKFDNKHHSGVYERVYKYKNIVEDIYKNPQQYSDDNLDHHTKVALRELALEEVRQKYYPNYPSRLSCLYVSETEEEAVNWYNYFNSLGRKVFQIVKVNVDGNIFKGDACNCFDGTTNKEENIAKAKIYWLGKNNQEGETPVHEIIVSGNIEVIEIITQKY